MNTTGVMEIYLTAHGGSDGLSGKVKTSAFSEAS